MPPLRSSTRSETGTARASRRRLAWALAAALLCGAPTFAQAATDRAHAEADRNGARLVLEWRRPVEYTVAQTDDYIFVRFSQPFAGPLDRARAPLARYLTELRLAGGGRVLVIRVAGKPRFFHQRRGTALVLTWIGPPSAERAAPRRRAPVADNPTDTDAPAGPPRARTAPKPPTAPPEMRADHPESPKTGSPVPKTPVAEREMAPARPRSVPGTEVRLLPSVKGAPAAPEGADAGQERARPSAPYTDALLPPPRPAAPPTPTERPAGPMPERAAPSGPPPKTPGTETATAPPRPTAPPAKRADRPAVAPPETPQPAAPAAPRAAAPPPPQAMAKAPEARRPSVEIRPAPEARPAPSGPLEPPVMPAVSPTLNVTRDGAETRLLVAWPEPVAAAVFRLGDDIWMVFSRREAFDLEKIQAQLGPGIAQIRRIEHAQATLLAVRARPEIRAHVTQQRNVWTVALKPDGNAPAAPEAKLAISRNGIEQAALPLPGAETPVTFVAPEAGSALHVAPSRATAAVEGRRTFVTFRILPAAQGGVIEALADGLVVGAERGAITIRRRAGLLLSNGGPSGVQHGQ